MNERHLSNRARPARRLVALLAALVVAGCGGGGGGGDIKPVNPPANLNPVGPNIFGLFPNPQIQADGTAQTNSLAYATAYYAAIDPTNAKDTLTKWKAANQFDTGTGQQVQVIFGDRRDLGYGRRMTARRNVDGTIAFFVENYSVNIATAYEYSTLNLDAAIAPDPRWLIGVNAIEFSPGPNGGTPFVKFYNFSGQTGQRQLAVDLDGRGLKFMPGPCTTCHGGRGDALTPVSASGQPLYSLVQNLPTGNRGDVQARLHEFDVDTFDFATTAPYRRTDQEANLKLINRWVLESFAIPAATAFPEDANRRLAQANEWQGTGADLIKQAYGGDTLPGATFSLAAYVPNSWVVAGQTTLYQAVVGPYCRTCHILRGNGAQSDLDFTTYAKFQAYADRIKAHVIDRGNMPLSRLVFDNFWESGGPEVLATFLQGQGYTVRDGSGAVLRPGRPIADPGPERVVRQGATTLSAANSLYSSSYAWSIVSGPVGGASLANANSVAPTFTATIDGTYVVQLVSASGATQSAPAQIRIVVDNTLPIAPAAIRFSDIKSVLQGAAGCTNAGCHVAGGQAPVIYQNVDRDGLNGIDPVDDIWFYEEVRSRINFTEIVASPLLRKPSNNHHNGNLRPGFDTSVAPGNAARANYDLFVNWIVNGAPR